MVPERTSLLTERISAGKRFYWFDVNTTPNGSIYLSICESRWTGKEYVRQKIVVFEQDIPAFSKTLTKTLEFIAGNITEK